MNIEHAKIMLKEIKFLDFKYELERTWDDYTCYLCIKVFAPDTRDRRASILIIHRSPICIDNTLTEKEFLELVFDRTIQAIRHEAAELFKFREHDIFNEHLDSKNRQEIINSMFRQEGETMRFEAVLDKSSNFM